MDILSEVCFKKLGIPASSTLREIEQAYDTKIKGLHPENNNDKEHISRETSILQVYHDYLCDSLSRDNTTWFEKNLPTKGYGILKFFLSNDFNEIINACIRRTRVGLLLWDEIKWKPDKNIPQKVKNLMNEYDMDYSMTLVSEDDSIIITKRITNQWFSTAIDVKPIRLLFKLLQKRR